MNKLVLRPSLMIKKETEGPVSISRLADLINDANRKEGTNCSVSRKTLTKIKNDPENVSLNFRILVALDTYFKKKGQGLQQLPILQAQGVLEALLNTQSVLCMLGAKPRPEERRIDVSQWDTFSL